VINSVSSHFPLCDIRPCDHEITCCTDVVLMPWPSETDSNGVKVRNISYTLSLTNTLGPKTSPCSERQVSSSKKMFYSTMLHTVVE